MADQQPAPASWWTRGRRTAARVAGRIVSVPYVLAAGSTMSPGQAAVTIGVAGAWGAGRYVAERATERQALRDEAYDRKPVAAAELHGVSRQELDEKILRLSANRAVMGQVQAEAQERADSQFRNGWSAPRRVREQDDAWSAAASPVRRLAAGGRVLSGAATAAVVGAGAGMDPLQVGAMTALGAMASGFAGGRARSDEQFAAKQETSAVALNAWPDEPDRARFVRRLRGPDAKRVAVELLDAERKTRDSRTRKVPRDEHHHHHHRGGGGR